MADRDSKKGWRRDTDLGQLFWQHDRVKKLERALEALGEDSGPEYQVLQSSLKKAKAQGFPIGVQLEQSLKFIKRSEKRRGTCQGGRRSETMCRSIAFRVGGGEPFASSSQLQFRGGTIAETGGRVESTVGATHGASSQEASNGEDLGSWIEERQRELQDAIRFGPRNAVLEISSMIADAGENARDGQQRPHVVKNRRFQDIRNARYGWRGVQVGEASHPGPQNTVARGEGFAVITRDWCQFFQVVETRSSFVPQQESVERVDDSSVSRVEDAQAQVKVVHPAVQMVLGGAPADVWCW